MEALSHIVERLWRFYADEPLKLLTSIGLAAALAITVLAAEVALLGWERSSAKRLLLMSNSSRTDLLAFVLVETSLGLFVGIAMLLGVTYVLQRYASAHVTRVVEWSPSLQILAVLAFYVTVDFANYWAHRWCHTVPALWEIHRYHHSAPEMTVLTAFRDHPMERAFSAAVVAVPAALVAMPAGDYVVVHLLAKLVGLIKHSNLPHNWGWFGRYVIQSPAAHWIHHSRDAAHHNKNFASLFQIWDVIFGTALHPSKAEAGSARIGLDDDDGQTPPARYLLRVFFGGWRTFLRIPHKS
ncbi:MAG: sterol desaturase family protein [Rhizobacter sp.]|nr:sterol desaturase family protein [Rhizobacter sp.]